MTVTIDLYQLLLCGSVFAFGVFIGGGFILFGPARYWLAQWSDPDDAALHRKRGV